MIFQYHKYDQNYIQHLFLILAVIIVIMLNACGFHLRRPMHLPFKTIFISLNHNSILHLELKQHLRIYGVKIVDDITQAEVKMEVLDEVRERKILSLSTDGHVNEYSLYLRFYFQLKNNQNQLILAPTKIFLHRDMTYTETQELAKQAEEILLFNDMQQELIQLILSQLSASKANVLLH